MIPDKKLIALYTGMIKCRMIVQRARELGPRPNLAPQIKVISGEESLLTGISADLLPGDTIISSSPLLLPALLHEYSLSQLLATPLQNGTSRTHAGVLASPPAKAAKSLPPSAGGLMQTICSAARAHLQTSKRRIALVLFRAEDGKSGHLRRSLGQASSENLPLVFVQRTEPANRPANAGKNGSAPRALASGVPIIAVDAGDVLALYRVASEAIARARHRRGPTLIDCVDNANARSVETAASVNSHARVRDSILDLESCLKERRLSAVRLKNRVELEFARQLDDAVRNMRG